MNDWTTRVIWMDGWMDGRRLCAWEGPKYLQFIIDHYDDLPDHTLFMHAHNKGMYSPSRWGGGAS